MALIVGIKELVWSEPEPEPPEINNTINNSDTATINVAETINQILDSEDEAEPIVIFNDISLEYISQYDDRISSHL